MVRKGAFFTSVASLAMLIAMMTGTTAEAYFANNERTPYGPPCCLPWTTRTVYKTYDSNPTYWDFYGGTLDTEFGSGCMYIRGWYYDGSWHPGASGYHYSCTSSGYSDMVSSVLTGTPLFGEALDAWNTGPDCYIQEIW
jgi:hypothetical protein